jgi:CotS family spore coat protein
MGQPLEPVLEQFGLLGANPDPLGDRLWRLETTEGTLALRAVKRPAGGESLAVAALEHLIAAGFTGLPAWRRSSVGSLGARLGRQTWLLSDWVPGHGALLGLEPDATASARGLAELHLRAVGLREGQDGPARDRYDSYPSRVRARIKAMRNYALVARSRLRPTAMDAAFLECCGQVLAEMEKLAAEVETAGYGQVATRSRGQRVFVFRSVGEGGIIITAEDRPRAIFVDWSSCRLDCHVRDLAKLLGRVLRASGGDWAPVSRTLAAYDEVRPMGDDERALLPPMLGFPERFYRLAQHYYENKRDLSDLAHIRRLRRAVSRHSSEARCAAMLRE